MTIAANVADEGAVQEAFLAALKAKYPDAQISKIKQGSIPAHNNFYPPEFPIILRNIDGLSAEQVANGLIEVIQSRAEASKDPYSSEDPKYISWRGIAVHESDGTAGSVSFAHDYISMVYYRVLP